MSIESFIRAMPKAELHVHLEGAVEPSTLLQLSKRNHVELPADTVAGLKKWYTFTDFKRFVEVYLKISDCIGSVEDIELIAREFLAGQAAQNIRYSEVTYTAFTHYYFKKLSFTDQLAALNRARLWAESEHRVTMRLIIDIPRVIPPREGTMVADWSISAMDDGVVALGLGGPEAGNPGERYREAFDRAHAAGLAVVPHAGETGGPDSIREALGLLRATRIGHGVRCLEDPALVEELRERQVPLEVCPTSNVCLHVARSLADHPLPRLIDAGLYVTLNSDDPALFNTTLTGEYLAAARHFGFGPDHLESLVIAAVRASLLPPDEKRRVEGEYASEFESLRNSHSDEQVS